MVKTEREKMLAGEPYLASDPELQQARLACRRQLLTLNQSLPDSSEWRQTLDTLLPNAPDAYIEPPFRCDYGQHIHTGKNFYANFNCVILDVAEVHIGDNVMLAPNVQLYTAGHPLAVKERVEEGVEFGLPITIGDNVWLGGGVIVCPGVRIGNNSVIGAGSVVTRDIPDNVLAAGNPCRIIRALNE